MVNTLQALPDYLFFTRQWTHPSFKSPCDGGVSNVFISTIVSVQKATNTPYKTPYKSYITAKKIKRKKSTAVTTSKYKSLVVSTAQGWVLRKHRLKHRLRKLLAP